MDSLPPTPAPIEPVAAPGEVPVPLTTFPPIDTGPYDSNPFTVSIHGLIQILKINPVAALGVSLVIFAGFFAVMLVTLIFSTLIQVPALAFLIGLGGYIVLLPTVIGSNLHVATKSMRGQKTTIREAIDAGLGKIVPLVGLGLLSSVLIMVGFVLLIVPGFIVLARISLASMVMFEENLGIVDSLKRSVKLTEGHTIEMLGAIFAGALLCTNGLLVFPATVSPLLARYHGLLALKEAKAKGPKVHWLNYVAPAAIIIIVGVAIIGNIIAAALSKSTTPTYSPTLENTPYNSTYQGNFPTNTN